MRARSAALCTVLFLAHLVAGEDPAASSPADELLKLATSASLSKLKEAYLELQWQRLIGTAALPALSKREDDDDAPKTPRLQGKKAAALSKEDQDKLLKWFEARKGFREKFLLALDPCEDEMPESARVALKLREKFPKESDQFENLLLAFAVVWDEPQIVAHCAQQGIPELWQKPPTITPCDESFSWYAKHVPQLCPGFTATPWRLLTFLVNEHGALPERDWVLKTMKFNPMLGKVYSDIVYDYSKLSSKNGKMQGLDYTLENLKKQGGVCRDQAYFARAVCRGYGLPAYMATATSNTGGLHAWVGWIVREGAEYKLQSHGRYEYDKYFTAKIIEPRTGKMIYDYLVGIEAKALSNEKTYDDADLYYRVWREVSDKLTPTQRNSLLVSAVKANPFHRQAWLAIGEATANGDLPAASAGKQWDYLSTQYREFPDFIFAMLKHFSKMFKTAAEKYQYYETGAKTFNACKRQDLVASLRLEEIEMCVAESRKDLGAKVAVAGVQECAGEGTQGVALAKRAMELLRETKQVPLGIPSLKQALSATPETRANRVNPNWRSLAELLRDAYTEVGDTKNADQLQARLARQSK